MHGTGHFQHISAVPVTLEQFFVNKNTWPYHIIQVVLFIIHIYYNTMSFVFSYNSLFRPSLSIPMHSSILLVSIFKLFILAKPPKR